MLELAQKKESLVRKDISKADALLDWHPTISVKEGIEMLWKNYK